MNYDFKVPDEAGWVAISVAAGGLVTVILVALGMDNAGATSIGVAVTGAARFVIAFLGMFIKSKRSADTPTPPSP